MGMWSSRRVTNVAALMGGVSSGALTLLGSETDGLSIDFTDATLVVADTTTTSNAWTGANGDVQTFWRDRSFTSYASPSPKITRDSSGTYTYRPHNFLAMSEKFKAAYWTTSNGTSTGDATTAPDNTTTATSYVPTAAAGTFFRVTRGTTILTATIPYTASWYVKANGYSKVHIMEDGFTNAAAVFDLSSEAVTATYNAGTFTVSNATITSVGSGWYRCSCTFNPTASTGMTLGIYVTRPAYASGDPMASSWTPDGTSGIYIWGAMLNAGPSALTYTKTQAHNLVLQSQVLGTSWTATSVTVGNNATTAPDGTTTAESLALVDASATHQLAATTIAFTTGLTYTFSLYAKASTHGFIQLAFPTGSSTFAADAYANFNLSTGATSAGAGATAVATLVGDSWYRCSITATATATATTAPLIVLVSAIGAVRAETWDPNSTNLAYGWGAQVELASSPGKYVATTTAAVYSANYDLPREWDSSGVCQGLLVEEARTNLRTYSNDQTQAIYIKLNGAAALTATGPDGVANSASTFTASAANAGLYTTLAATAATYAISFFAKRRTGSGAVTIGRRSVSGATLITNGAFDADTNWAKGTGWTIAAGVANSAGGNAFASIQQTLNLTPGKMYQVVYTITRTAGDLQAYVGTNGSGGGPIVSASATYTQYLICTNAANGLYLRAGSGGFTGTVDNVSVKLCDDTNIATTIDADTSKYHRISFTETFASTDSSEAYHGIYLATSGDAIDISNWQVELGAFATSPIYTVSASVTRAGDLGVRAATSIMAYSQSAVTLYAKGTPQNLDASATVQALLGTDDATSNERHLLYRASANPQSITVDGGVTQADVDGGSWGIATSRKIAASIAANDVAISFNGGAAVTDATATMPAVHTIGIGNTNSLTPFNGHIAQIMVLPRAMSDAELVAITT
jgi:hypothetical protein